jgi:nuclear transport factor 2 (NTF2) superfamily protein
MIGLAPPFELESATRKVRAAEDLWNSRDPSKVVRAYTPDSHWRNRGYELNGRESIRAFLERKWSVELEYRLVKELWGFRLNRMAVRFCYESRDGEGRWMRSFGNELWEFDEQGLMLRRYASVNDVPIDQADRKLRWPLGPRPTDHPGLSALGI